jgi:hypothetical protein
MWYFILGIILGIILHLAYQFIVEQYLRIKREVWFLRNERESHLREISNIKDYYEWKRTQT